MSFKEKYIEWCVRRDKGWSPGVLTYFDEDFDNFMEDLINSVLIDMKNTKLIFEAGCNLFFCFPSLLQVCFHTYVSFIGVL